MTYIFSKNALIVLLCGIVTILFMLHLDGCNNKKIQADLYNATQDSLHKTVNKLGQEVSYKKLIVGSLNMLRAVNLSYKDSLLNMIRQSADNSTIAKTDMVNTTINDNKVKSIVAKIDTVTKNGVITLYPVYKGSWSTKWRKGNVYASNDSIECRDTIINEFDITTEYKRDHFWTVKYPVVEVVNKNPHTKTLDVSSFQLKADAGRQSRLVVFLEGVLVGGLTYMILRK